MRTLRGPCPHCRHDSWAHLLASLSFGAKAVRAIDRYVDTRKPPPKLCRNCSLCWKRAVHGG